jgi:hypothetical protein
MIRGRRRQALRDDRFGRIGRRPLGANTRGGIKMLAPLAVYAAIILITCALVLLIGWACDNDRAEIEAGQSRRAVQESVTEGGSAGRTGRVSHIEAPEFLTIGIPVGLASLDPPYEIALEITVADDRCRPVFLKRLEIFRGDGHAGDD